MRRLAFAVGLVVTLAGGTAADEGGLVVESVARRSVGERAGLRPGDVLASWFRSATPPANPADASGVLSSPFDLAEIEIEQAPRGPIRLVGSRAGDAITFDLSASGWGIGVRPQFSGATDQRYGAGREAIEANDLDRGTGIWRELAGHATDPTVACWLRAANGAAFEKARKWPEAEAEYEAALNAISERPKVAAQILIAKARALQRQGNAEGATRALEEAQGLLETEGKETLAVAATLAALAELRGPRPAAQPYATRARDIRARVAPDSVVLVQSLAGLAQDALVQGDYARTESLGNDARERLEAMAPAAPEMAQVLNTLAGLARARGENARARELAVKALSIGEGLGEAQTSVIESLRSLSAIAFTDGRFIESQRYLRRALAIARSIAPDTLQLAAVLNSLGTLTRQRGDLRAAEDLLREGLAVRERLAPETDLVIGSLGNLADVFVARGDWDSAEMLWKRASSIAEKVSPESPFAALLLLKRGEHCVLRRGDLVEGERLLRHALSIEERRAPRGAIASWSRFVLAEIARRRGDLPLAEASLSKVLEEDPRNVWALATLARTYKAQGATLRAIETLEHALELVDDEQRTVGLAEYWAEFGARYAGVYRLTVAFLVEAQRPADAFHTLERFKARQFLAALTAKRVQPATAGAATLEEERRRIDGDYDQTTASLLRTDAGDGNARQALLARLSDLRTRRASLIDEIRTASPDYAAAHYPQVLNLGTVQDALDPGTVLLSYSVGEQETLLFVAAARRSTTGSPQFKVVRIPIGAKVLGQRVQAFRDAIHRSAVENVVAAQLGAELYDALIRPAEDLVATAERLLIIPDTPLDSLPFAALRRPAATTKGGVARRAYLIESKPLHTALSASVFADLKKARRAGVPGADRMVLFGDPEYPRLPVAQIETLEDDRLRTRLRGGAFAPLRWTREEVESVARLFPGASVYLGKEATEERAKTAVSEARYVHFACHGFVDNTSPLDSGLALTIREAPSPGQENGILQVWEILDSITLNADLVTLSACDTGLGADVAGEGFVGLVRAFQYAGARSVLASLWATADRSTAAFMRDFYDRLKHGASKDQALQGAQIHMIRKGGADARSLRWAGFELLGDWR